MSKKYVFNKIGKRKRFYRKNLNSPRKYQFVMFNFTVILQIEITCELSRTIDHLRKLLISIFLYSKHSY